MKKVSVVIVNYNTKEILKDCLKNLLSISKEFEIIVVDNASKDSSVEMVKAHFPTVKLVALTENKGLAFGSNRGLELCTRDFILYLGTDAFPNKSTISGMVSYFEKNPDVGAATPKLVTRDGSLDMDAHRGFPTPWAALTHFSNINKLFPNSKLFNKYFLGGNNLNEPHEIDLCIAHFMLVRKEVFDQVGNWDENYFVYGEDVDMCYRIKEAGWKIMYLPQWEAVHYKGVSVGVRKETRDITKASKETKEKMRKSTTEAMALFYEKHYKDRYPSIVTGFVLFGISLLGRFRQLRK